MNYVIWRLHRNQAYFAGAVIAALAIVLGITGLVMSRDYTGALATCGATHSCADLSSSLFQGDNLLIDLVNKSIIAPVLMGLFWGAPLVAKELEDGTNVLAWTQTVTRPRWMSSNIIWALVAAAVWGGALSALITWWRIPENALVGRFAAFDDQGVAPVAYSVFAVALGIAAGTFLKRLLPALATTLAVLVTLRAVIALYVRPHFLPPIRAIVPLINDQSGAPSTAWVLTRNVVDPAGHIVNTSDISFLPPSCATANAQGNAIPCLSRLGYHRLVTYQPDDRFWTFQAIEAGIFIALAAVLVALAYRTVVRRDA